MTDPTHIAIRGSLGHQPALTGPLHIAIRGSFGHQPPLTACGEHYGTHHRGVIPFAPGTVRLDQLTTTIQRLLGQPICPACAHACGLPGGRL